MEVSTFAVNEMIQHITTTTIKLYDACDHSLSLDVVYGGGGVMFHLHYSRAGNYNTCCTDTANALDVDFFGLSEKQIIAITKGEECVCEDIKITVDKVHDKVLLKYDMVKERMAIPQRYLDNVGREIAQAVDDWNLMSMYARPSHGEARLLEEDPEAQRVLVLACLHASFRGDNWDRSSGIHDYLDGKNGKRSIGGSKFVALATRLVDTLTTVDVNEFLHETGCYMYHEPSREPVVKSLFDDLDRVIDNVLYGRLSPSGEYFAHLPRCLKSSGERLEKMVEHLSASGQINGDGTLKRKEAKEKEECENRNSKKPRSS